MLLCLGYCKAQASSSESSTMVTNWTGNGDGSNWHDGTNWDNGIPDLQKQAIIDDAGAFISITNHIASARAIRLIQGNIAIDTSLQVDGQQSMTQTIGIENLSAGQITVTPNGSIIVSQTNSDGIGNNGTFTNHGTITVTNATFASIQESSDNGSFTNYGQITINSPGTRGVQVSFDGHFINHGAIFVNQADWAIWMRDGDTQLDNYGELWTGAGVSNSIKTTSATSGAYPSIINHECASIIAYQPYAMDDSTDYSNAGLIFYTATSHSEGFSFNYIDTGYQYDPNGWLSDGSSVVLSNPLSHDDFTADLDGDSVSLCVGDDDDFPYGPCPSVLYVDVTRPSSNSDGLSWATAFPELQDAIDVATICADGPTQIWVAEGTYYPTEIHDVDEDGDEVREKAFYINKDMKIYGGFAGDETSVEQRDIKVHETILSGDLDQNDAVTIPVASLQTHISRAGNAFHVVIIDGTSANGNISAACLIDGFSITGGHANENNGQFNFNSNGGGILNLGCGGLKISSPDIANCNFSNNAAFEAGGAIFNGGETGIANPQIRYCLFEENAASKGGAMHNAGRLGVASPMISYCDFRYNQSGADGGAIDYISPDGRSDIQIQNSSFFKNITVQGEGGAISLQTTNKTSSSSIVNSTFTGNTAACCAQTISTSCNGGTCTLEIDNSIMWDANGMNLNNTTTTIRNSVVNDGIEDDNVTLPSGATGTNNIDRYPEFIDTTSGDLRLRSSSPAIDAGLTPAVPAHLTTDLQGQTRIHNSRVDIGAYERAGCGQSTVVLGSPDDDIAMDATSIITNGEITASNVISDNAEVTYNAEDGVILEDDFRVDQSAQLEISQEGCDTTSLIYYKGLQGYITSRVDGNSIPPDHTAGLGFYAALWTLTPEPIAGFQIGLPSTWITPDNSENTTDPLCPIGTYARSYNHDRAPTYDYVFQTIEGGLGYWVNQRFKYTTPKFMMNSVPDCYNSQVATPGWPFFGSGQPLADDQLGIVQLSNRLVIPPDGMTFDGSPHGEFLGTSYLALPFSQPHTTGGTPTGVNNWTLFFNAANFKGPIAYFVPEMYSKISEDYAFDHGRGMDNRMHRYDGGATMEIGTLSSYTEEDAGGTVYSKIPQLQFPVDAQGKTTLAKDWAYYSKDVLYNDVLTWLAGGTQPSGVFNSSGVVYPTINTYPNNFRQDDIPIPGMDNIAVNTIHSDNSFGFVWDPEFVEGTYGKLPNYFKEVNGIKIPIQESDLPAEVGLASQQFDPVWPTPSPYEAPLTGAWATPGPSAGPFYAELQDSSVITYYWYRFIDQPVFQQFNWPQGEKDALQAMAEQVHENWTPDKEYMQPMTSGTLVSMDPGILVTPPPGLEKGYVPIVVKQSSFMDADDDNDGYSIATDSDDNDPNVH